MTRLMSSSKQKKSTRPSRKLSRRRSSIWKGILDKPWILRGVAIISSVIVPCILWIKGYPQQLWDGAVTKTIEVAGQAGYALQDLYVEGRMHAPHDQMLRAIGLSRGDAILRFSPAELKERLEGISWIEEAIVQRRLPGTLYVKIRERRPVAFWQHKQKHFLVDSQGVILSCENVKPFEGLPVIVGDDAPVHAPKILKTLSDYPEVRQRVTALVWVGGRRWDIHLNNKVQVKLPEDKTESALSRLKILLMKNKVNSAELAVIDLRLPDKLVMRLSPAASIQLHGKGKET